MCVKTIHRLFFGTLQHAFERSHPAQYESLRSHAPDVCVNGIEVFGFVRSGSRCGKFIRSRVRQPVCRDSESTPVFDIVFIVC